MRFGPDSNLGFETYIFGVFLSFLFKIEILDLCELDYRKSVDAMYLRVIGLVKPHEIWT